MPCSRAITKTIRSWLRPVRRQRTGRRHHNLRRPDGSGSPDEADPGPFRSPDSRATGGGQPLSIPLSAILAQKALNDISGTGLERYQKFRTAFDDFLRTGRGFSRHISGKTLVSTADLAQLPQFKFRDEQADSLPAALAPESAGLAFATAMAAVFWMLRLPRYPVAS